MQPILKPVNSQYGAPMGRTTFIGSKTPRLYLRRICPSWRGYDKGGAYWGISFQGEGIYWARDDKTDTSLFVRATSRREAQKKVRAIVPGATFVRNEPPHVAISYEVYRVTDRYPTEEAPDWHHEYELSLYVDGQHVETWDSYLETFNGRQRADETLAQEWALQSYKDALTCPGDFFDYFNEARSAP